MTMPSLVPLPIGSPSYSSQPAWPEHVPDSADVARFRQMMDTPQASSETVKKDISPAEKKAEDSALLKKKIEKGIIQEAFRSMMENQRQLDESMRE